ncbi:MAG TPA: ChbG/HpnK family deacetylase [Pyrinomonadaceae bacterium]
MKRLVINADDFGLTKGVTAGIVETMLRGAVTSTTAMACKAGSLDNVREWAGQIKGRIGVHLQLTDGLPCSESTTIPSLVTESGLFPRSRRDLRALNTDEVRLEWRAQIERIIQAGITPTHIDSHHHVHRYPAAFAAYCEIAAEHAIPARAISAEMAQSLRARGVRCADYCETGWYGGELTPDSLIACLDKAFAALNNDDVTLELMCHPGFVDGELPGSSNYVAEREQELRTLCRPELAARLRESGIKLIAMSDL